MLLDFYRLENGKTFLKIYNIWPTNVVYVMCLSKLILGAEISPSGF